MAATLRRELAAAGYVGQLTWLDIGMSGTLADLVVGRRVEVRGLLAADRRTLQATRIDFE